MDSSHGVSSSRFHVNTITWRANLCPEQQGWKKSIRDERDNQSRSNPIRMGIERGFIDQPGLIYAALSINLNV
jgi:hypothetical protein